MKLKKSRTAGFAIILAVYLFAAALGIVLYCVLPFTWWLSLLLADIAATVFVFLFSVLLGNASVYDPYWSVQPPVILIAFAAVSEGITPVRLCLLITVLLWGLRLTANWAYTFGDLTHQDWRYTMLCGKTGRFYPLINLVGIHMVPTLVVYLCTLPAVFAFREALAWNAGTVVFTALSLAATLIQGIADLQMHRFRRRATGGFIREGLWKYSRHPNYLGEILMWWGVGLAVVSVSPAQWYLLAGALANTALFAFVSIPMAERRQSKKEGFAAYKKQTRVLLPIKK